MLTQHMVGDANGPQNMGKTDAIKLILPEAKLEAYNLLGLKLTCSS
jgi:hypothetical protein